MSSKEKIFSIPASEFRIDTFRAGGKGGQKQNKTDSGVRITHIKSGAVGEARDERSQPQNKKNAFRRCVESKKFQLWLKMEIAARMKGYRDLDAKIDEMMKEGNLKVEYYDPGETNGL